MIRFVPYYMPLIWGGRRLESLFGRSLPQGPVGESWELCELGERHSVAADGAHRGKTLGDLWRQGALGGSGHGPFPFLLKWIDATQNLSVQVHPPAATCAALGFGQPKTEAWYVADVLPDAKLMMGHYPGFDAPTLKLAAANGTLGKWIYETWPKPADIFFLKSGTVHAIGAGCMLLEVQQPSDTTFRLYDWGRVGTDGMPRQLHLSESAASVLYNQHGPLKPMRAGVVGPCFSLRPLTVGESVAAQQLRVFAAPHTPATLESAAGQTILQRGDVVVAQPQDGAVSLQSGSAVLVGEP